MIRERITDPRSLGSCCIKGTNDSTLGKDFLVPLIHHNPSDLGSVILKGTQPKRINEKILHVSFGIGLEKSRHKEYVER